MESIMTGLAPTSSSFSYEWTYDVFINFRGEDTRQGFTGHLYNALNKAGIRTFFDDTEIRRGEEITPALLNAIENSRMAITVFSEKYASSTFCLDELVQIHECIKRKGWLVLPIFYGVDPSQVRHQKGNYEQALSMHMENLRADKDKIQSWKLALYEVANISGDHLDPGKNGYEYQFIERIVKDISSRISRVPLHVAEYPVGLESRVLTINSLLQIGSTDKVIMVGICGSGGMGKTTIALAMYNSIADNFEGLCFLHDVKEKSRKAGLDQIQQEILSELVGVDIKIQVANKGVELMKMRLKQKKLLLILDDVDNHEQLKKLAGDCNWFSGGSRIIITTRDKHLLVRHGVESIYYMEAFNDDESLELLRWNAFKSNPVNPSCMKVLYRAVSYAQGLPLALEVIGSNLYKKTTDKWESMLDAYKSIPSKNIQQVLKVSYEGLEEVEKEIFLDMACFFKGKKLEYVKYIVEVVHGYKNLSYYISVLEDKCLIEKNYEHIEMHDLIRDMGREIVREESPSNPGGRSRLWFHEDIIDVLENNTGTHQVRMIIQDKLSRCIEVDWDGEAFKSMRGLKILIFEYAKFSESPKYLPNSLRVLKWKGYPSSCWPPNFCPKKLVMLDIGYSYLSSLEAIKTSGNLSVLNLKGCECVTAIPELSNLKNLEQLNLKGCKNLIEIHDSIGDLPKLKILYAEGCVRLKAVPHAIKSPSLEMLELSGCSSLKYFPEILEKLKMTFLGLHDTGIEKLPWSICNLSKLRTLWITQVIEIPNCIFSLPEIKEIRVDSEGKVTSHISQGAQEKVSCSKTWDGHNDRHSRCIYELRRCKSHQEQAILSEQCPNSVFLQLRRCNISDGLLRTYLSPFINVKSLTLDLTGNNFTILPAWIKEYHSLRSLDLNECKYLREVEGIPPNITHLGAINCVSLSSESRSALLSEELLGDPSKMSSHYVTFFVPSRSIPKWFDHTNKGASISFWFRNRFPRALCLCVLLKPTGATLHISSYVNYERYTSAYMWPPVDASDVDHLVAYNLIKYDTKEDNIHDERVFQKNKWNHVQIYVRSRRGEAPVVIEESGMYVNKQLCDMADISFKNPNQPLDSDMDYIVPSRSIPEWFGHRNKGASISFWCRNRCPKALRLCVLFKPTGAPLDISSSINYQQSASRSLWFWPDASGVDHLAVYNLVLYYKEEDDTNFGPKVPVFCKNKWNHVQINVRSGRDEAPMVIEESGMYVNKQLCVMADISFKNPSQTLDSTTAFQERLGTSMDEKEGALDKKGGLMWDDKFASSSTALIRYTKGGKNCSIINQDDNDAITPEIPCASASDIINNQEQEERIKVHEKGIQEPHRRMKIHSYILELGVFVGILSLLFLFISNTTSYT